MKIVIAAATEMELRPFIHLMGIKNGVSIEGWITGVGSISTTHFLTENISNLYQSLVIQVGIAGCFKNTIEIGSAVVVEDELINDMGVFEKDGYMDIFSLGLLDENSTPFQHGVLHNPNAILLQDFGLKFVRSIGVNEISTNPKKIKLFKEHYKAEIESMEGSAFHYVCLMRNIPFIQIRGISNIVGERNKSKWKIKDAIDAIMPPILKLISQYSENTIA